MSWLFSAVSMQNVVAVRTILAEDFGRRKALALGLSAGAVGESALRRMALDPLWNLNDTPIKITSTICAFFSPVTERIHYTQPGHSKDGYTSLHEAARSTDGLEIVRLLVKRSPEAISSLDSYNNTPLHIAAYMGSLEVVQFLVETRPEPALHKKNNEGEVPLHRAASRYSNLLMVKFLVEKAPDTASFQTRFGKTPLRCAVEKNELEVVKLLAQTAPKTVSCPDYRREIPLHIAVLHCYLEVAKFLAQKTAPTTIWCQNCEKITPLDIAVRNCKKLPAPEDDNPLFATDRNNTREMLKFLQDMQCNLISLMLKLGPRVCSTILQFVGD